MNGRIAALVARATHPNTPTEEARTCAMLALQMLVAAGWTPDAPLVEAPNSAPPDASRTIRSKYPGWCRACRGTYSVGDYIYWRRGAGATHTYCRQEAA